MKCGTHDAPNSATSTFSPGNRPNRLSKISADNVSVIGRSPYRLFHCHADMCHDPGHGSSPHAAATCSLYQFSMMWNATVTPASFSLAHTGSNDGSPGERPCAGPVGSSTIRAPAASTRSVSATASSRSASDSSAGARIRPSRLNPHSSSNHRLNDWMFA